MIANEVDFSRQLPGVLKERVIELGGYIKGSLSPT